MYMGQNGLQAAGESDNLVETVNYAETHRFSPLHIMNTSMCSFQSTSRDSMKCFVSGDLCHDIVHQEHPCRLCVGITCCELCPRSNSYVRVCRRIQAIVEGKPHHLIETVAEDIAQAILKNHAAVQATKVKVSKPHVSLPSPLEYVQVEIFRTSSS